MESVTAADLACDYPTVGRDHETNDDTYVQMCGQHDHHRTESLGLLRGSPDQHESVRTDQVLVQIDERDFRTAL